MIILTGPENDIITRVNLSKDFDTRLLRNLLDRRVGRGFNRVDEYFFNNPTDVIPQSKDEFGIDGYFDILSSLLGYYLRMPYLRDECFNECGYLFCEEEYKNKIPVWAKINNTIQKLIENDSMVLNVIIDNHIGVHITDKDKSELQNLGMIAHSYVLNEEIDYPDPTENDKRVTITPTCVCGNIADIHEYTFNINFLPGIYSPDKGALDLKIDLMVSGRNKAIHCLTTDVYSRKYIDTFFLGEEVSVRPKDDKSGDKWTPFIRTKTLEESRALYRDICDRGYHLSNLLSNPRYVNKDPNTGENRFLTQGSGYVDCSLLIPNFDEFIHKKDFPAITHLYPLIAELAKHYLEKDNLFDLDEENTQRFKGRLHDIIKYVDERF